MINWWRVFLGVSGGLFWALVIYGAYHFYFDKPIPVTNNNTFQPGSSVEVKQGTQEKRHNFGVVGGPVFLGGKFGAFFGVSFRF